MELISTEWDTPLASPTTPFTMSFAGLDGDDDGNGAEFLAALENLDNEPQSYPFLESADFALADEVLNDLYENDFEASNDQSLGAPINESEAQKGEDDAASCNDKTQPGSPAKKPLQKDTRNGELSNAGDSSSTNASLDAPNHQEFSDRQLNISQVNGNTGSVAPPNVLEHREVPESEPRPTDSTDAKGPNEPVDAPEEHITEVGSNSYNLYDNTEHNGPNAFVDGTDHQSSQESEITADLDTSFDTLFNSIEWDMSNLDAGAWDLNGWDAIHDETQGSLPMSDQSGQPASLEVGNHPSNPYSFSNLLDNDNPSNLADANQDLGHYESVPKMGSENRAQTLSPQLHPRESQQCSNAGVSHVGNTVAVSTKSNSSNVLNGPQQIINDQHIKPGAARAARAVTGVSGPQQRTQGTHARTIKQPFKVAGGGVMNGTHLQNANGRAPNAARQPSHNLLQQRSHSISAGTVGSSKEEAINLISPVASSFNHGSPTASASAAQTSSMSRQSTNNSCLSSSPNSNSMHLQRSPGSSHQRQNHQQMRHPQSSLRHMSVPGQSDGYFEASPNARHQLLQIPVDNSHNLLRMRATSPMGPYQLNLAAGNNTLASHSQGYGNDEAIEKYLTNLGNDFTRAQVNDFRDQSQTNHRGSSHSHYGSSASPQLNLGNHRAMTQDIYQSPQQRPISLLSQPLALQHLAPIAGLPTNFAFANSHQPAYTNSMKHETSSPESASGARGKLNQVPQHASRRLSQASMPQQPTINSMDQHRVNLLFNAMMDMSNPQDNEGMLKTWRGLMKEKDKIQEVCFNILGNCYKLERAGRPLQQAIKAQNTYESLDSRIHHICEAFKNQKTMCKHLLEAPYVCQVVDDPILAANRVVNNRKVNKGKKQAIDAGRAALKAVNPQQAGETSSELGYYGQNDEEDAAGDDDDDYTQLGQDMQSSVSPSVGRTPLSNKRAASNGPNYRGSTPKKAKRPSKYQLNDQGQMVQVGDDGVASQTRRLSQATPHAQRSNRSSANYSQPAFAGYTFSGADFEADIDIQSEHSFNHGIGNFPRFGGPDYSGVRGARLGSGQQHQQ